MAWAPLIMMAISTVVSVVGAIQQASAAKDAAEHNASVARRNADIANEQAAQDAETQRRQAQKRLGLMRANIGASGIQVEGSPLDVLEESAASAEFDRQTILYKGRIRALGYEDEARAAEYEGDRKASAAYGKAGSSLLGGASSMFGMSGGFGGGGGGLGGSASTSGGAAP